MITVLLIPIGMAIMIWIECRLFAYLWDRRLRVEVLFGADHAVVGEETTLEQTVSNAKLLPILVLQIGYQTDIGLDIQSESKVTVSDHVNIVEVFSLRPYEQTSRSLRVVCQKRGYYRIRRTTLKAYHHFGLSSYYKNVDQETELYVYPERIRLSSLFMVIDRLSGDLKARNYLYEDPFTFRGIRDYTPHDPMGQINWKAAARTGDLKVNIRDYTAGQRVLLLLNLENPASPYADDLLEDSIRVTATIAERLLQHQIPVSMLTNGQDCVTGLSPSLGAGSSADHLQILLEELARLEIHRTTVAFEDILEDRIQKAAGAEEACCIISSARRDRIAMMADRLGAAQGGILWVCPLTEQAEQNVVGSHIEFVRVNHEDTL